MNHEKLRPLAGLRRRGEWLWAPALYLVTTLLLYRVLWWGYGGVRGYFGWDMLESYWGDLGFVATAFRQGEWPLWNPFDRAGYPFHADPQSGVYYPVTWLFAAVAALGDDTPAWLIQAKALAHFVLVGSLVHLYLRSRGLTKAVAVFGGVLAVASGPMVWHKASNVLWPQVWAPLVWLAIDRAVEGAGSSSWWRRSALLAVAVLLPAVAGSPPGFFYVMLAGGAYGAFRIVQALRAGPVNARRLALTFGVAVAAAAPILALVYLPTRELIAYSPRAVRTLGYALDGGLAPGYVLAGWVAPQLGILGVYNSLLLPCFVLLAMVARSRADRWAPLFFVGFAAFFACLAFGPHTPLLGFLVKHAPGFGLFRVPPRYTILADVALIVVAAHGVAALLDAPGRRRLGAALGCVAAVAIVVLAIRHFAAPTASYGFSFLVLALAAGLVTALFFAPRARGALVVALAALAYVDAAHGLDPFLKITEPVPDPRNRRVLDGLDGVRTEWRILDEFVMEHRPGSRYGVREMRGYIAGDPLEDLRYRDLMRRTAANPELLEAFNVRWILHGRHHRHGVNANNIKRPPPPPHWKALDARRHEAQHPAPLVAWYGAVTVVAGPAQTLDAILASESPEGIRTHAIVEKPDIPPTEAAALTALSDARPSVAGRLLSYGFNRIAVAIDAPADGLVVLNEKFFPGWQVTVDGHPATPIQTNSFLRGVLVQGAGHHDIVWTYRPPHHRPLALGSLVSLTFFLVAAFKRRREMPASTWIGPKLGAK